MPDNESPSSLYHSEEILNRAIKATENLLETLRLQEETPARQNELRFYLERLELLVEWKAKLPKSLT